MFNKLTSSQINESLVGINRQYLVGHLQLPQILEHIDDSNIEIGVTDYKNYTVEKTHKHKVAYECQYMISGETKYLDVDTRDEFLYREGDFYRIVPDTAYAQKALPGTTILFIKTPPGNDKIIIDSDDFIEKWSEQWEVDI
ncbi:MAG: hypothetical protein LBM93_10360 [Oscillospiraceae bacterium]|jgi:quercetin dioxygenase-like cupin family protein|nr:hypothetical protein [Oscillospiraceae bacterium]